MASTYTTRIRLEKQGDGENPNSWGDILNQNVIDLVDSAIAAYTTVSISIGDVTLTTNDGSTDQARSAFIEFVGTVSNNINVVIPGISKGYIVKTNFTAVSAGASMTLKTAAGTGLSFTENSTGIVVCDGVSVFGGTLNALTGASVSVANGTFNTVKVNTSLGFQDTDNGNYISLQAPTSIASNISFTLPEADGTSGQVMQTNGSGVLSFTSVTVPSPTPTGLVSPYAGTTEPSGWLFCYGQAISRSTYADLFSVISTTYGVGDGATTFNLPDLRGRVVAGQDDMGGSSADRLTGQSGGVDGDTLGASGGGEQHTLTISEMPSHNHNAGGSTSFAQGDSAPANARNTAAGTLPTSDTGGGSAHNNVQPTFILNYIIKT